MAGVGRKCKGRCARAKRRCVDYLQGVAGLLFGGERKQQHQQQQQHHHGQGAGAEWTQEKTRRGVSGRSCKGRQQTSSYPTRRCWSGEFHVLHLPHPLSGAACIARLLPPFDEPSSLTMYITWIVSPAAPPTCRPRASICHEAGCTKDGVCVVHVCVCLHACMHSRSAPTTNTNTSDLCPAALTPTCTPMAAEARG